MTYPFFAARVLDWNEQDFLVILAFPHQVATVQATARLFSELREVLGEVRFVLRIRLPDAEDSLLGAIWLTEFLKTKDLDSLDWRPMPVSVP